MLYINIVRYSKTTEAEDKGRSHGYTQKNNGFTCSSSISSVLNLTVLFQFDTLGKPG